MPDTQLDTLLLALLEENPDLDKISLPADIGQKRKLLRLLMNVRPPRPLPAGLQAIQDRELAAQMREKGVVLPGDIPPSPLDPRLRLWQGDITRLAAGAIVNAANSQMLGCFQPLHNCIDNAIHSAAGMQLREECQRLMEKQGFDEPTGGAKITRAYNLPAQYVIHTVGPIVYGPRPTEEDCRLLASCYASCINLAGARGLSSLAFCCISTGVFRFPPKKAAKIAVNTVQEYFAQNPASPLEIVVFDVFKEEDLNLYRTLLGYAQS